MTAGPLNHDHDPLDPEDILRRLPYDERERFIRDYRSALDAAHELWRYRQLQRSSASGTCGPLRTPVPTSPIGHSRHARAPRPSSLPLQKRSPGGLSARTALVELPRRAARDCTRPNRRPAS
ncbi:DUF6247 family protein [Actinomadura madurae]|uniref:DUF6247 family protein n=1 Tax=Actinomadura madurae TaxID=1993 RepID=UPI0034DAC11B